MSKLTSTVSLLTALAALVAAIVGQNGFSSFKESKKDVMPNLECSVSGDTSGSVTINCNKHPQQAPVTQLVPTSKLPDPVEMSFLSESFRELKEQNDAEFKKHRELEAEILKEHERQKEESRQFDIEFDKRRQIIRDGRDSVFKGMEENRLQYEKIRQDMNTNRSRLRSAIRHRS